MVGEAKMIETFLSQLINGMLILQKMTPLRVAHHQNYHSFISIPVLRPPHQHHVEDLLEQIVILEELVLNHRRQLMADILVQLALHELEQPVDHLHRQFFHLP
jgi:hypothetical protein